jgi:hypothetical protein
MGLTAAEIQFYREITEAERDAIRVKRALIGRGEHLTEFYRNFTLGALAMDRATAMFLGVNPHPDASPYRREWDRMPRATQLEAAWKDAGYYLATLDWLASRPEFALGAVEAATVRAVRRRLSALDRGLDFAAPYPEPIKSPNITGGRVPLFATHGDYSDVMRDLFTAMRYLRDWAADPLNCRNAGLGTHNSHGQPFVRYTQAIDAFYKGIGLYAGVTWSPEDERKPRAHLVIDAFKLLSRDLPNKLFTMDPTPIADCWARLDAHWANALWLESAGGR